MHRAEGPQDIQAFLQRLVEQRVRASGFFAAFFGVSGDPLLGSCLSCRVMFGFRVVVVPIVAAPSLGVCTTMNAYCTNIRLYRLSILWIGINDIRPGFRWE
ncbi:hypothetical protein ACU4GD_27700 [Cupriavidus basilensis]